MTNNNPVLPAHHIFQGFCKTRPKYRDGNRPKAVKAYTVNLESKYLIVQNVPAVNVVSELTNLFRLFGTIVEHKILGDYPKMEKFNQVLLLKFERLPRARLAKRKMDNFSFMGNVLHVFYAPEYEIIDETREKLNLRRVEVAKQLKSLKNSTKKFNKRKSNDGFHCNKSKPALDMEPGSSNVTKSLDKSVITTNNMIKTSEIIQQGQWQTSLIHETFGNTLNVTNLLLNAQQSQQTTNNKFPVEKSPDSLPFCTSNLSSPIVVKNYSHRRKHLQLISRQRL